MRLEVDDRKIYIGSDLFEKNELGNEYEKGANDSIESFGLLSVDIGGDGVQEGQHLMMRIERSHNNNFNESKDLTVTMFLDEADVEGLIMLFKQYKKFRKKNKIT